MSASDARRPRTILVTGASRGIGEALARELLDRGDHLIGVSRSPAPSSLHSERTDWLQLDLVEARRSTDTIGQRLREHRRRQPGAPPVDAVVLNAGRGDIGALDSLSADTIVAGLTLNLVAPLLLARQCLPLFRQQSRSNIVFIGSESALRAARYGSVYSAAKFGLRGAAQSLRDECAAGNCHVGIVHPGMVRTTFFDELAFEPGPEPQHALQALDVAAAVITMLDAPDHAVVDEISVNPRQRVVHKRAAPGSPRR